MGFNNKFKWKVEQAIILLWFDHGYCNFADDGALKERSLQALCELMSKLIGNGDFADGKIDEYRV